MQPNKNKALAIFFTICLGLLSSQTYSIYGIIKDSETLTPLENVSIFISDSDVGTTTDVEGYFVLLLNTELENISDLNIKLIGYRQQTIQLSALEFSINIGHIMMIPESIKGKSVHIHTHDHKSKQISDIILGGQELNDNLTGNIATTLSKQPNIGSNSFGMVTSKPVLRGYTGDRFLLTKDGSKTGDLSQSSIDHVIALDMSDVNEIEIIRGPKSLLYGSNAIGGVIYTTINGNPKNRVTTFIKKMSLGLESFNNSFYSNIGLYIPYKDNQINFVFNKRDSDNQTSPIGELDNTYSQTLNYKLGWTRYNKVGYINYIAENFTMNYGIPSSDSGHINGVDIELNKNTFQINFHRDISLYNFNQLDIIYNYIDYEHREFENNLNYYSVLLSKLSNDLKIKIQTPHSTIGLDMNLNQFQPSGFYWTPNTTEFDYSFYGYTENEFNKYDLLASFRIGHLSIIPNQGNNSYANIDSDDVIDKIFEYISYSMGIRKHIKKYEFNSWFMQTMKPPRVEELYSDGPHLGTYSYEIGNPNLMIEKIYGNETSILYKNDRFITSITGFYNYSPYYYQISKMGHCEEEYVSGESHPCAGADYIEWGSGSNGWLYKYDTKGVKSIIKGIEFNIGYSYKNLNVVYDFSMVSGDNLTDNVPLSYINPDKHIGMIEYQTNFNNYKLRATYINGQKKIGEFETETGSSALLDLIVSYNKSNYNITIQLNNILNQTYYNHLSRIKEIMPEPGRNIIFNYKIFF